MNCTDRIVVGLVLVVGALTVEAVGLPPVVHTPAFLLGLGSLLLGMWQAGRLVTAAGSPGSGRSTHLNS